MNKIIVFLTLFLLLPIVASQSNPAQTFVTSPNTLGTEIAYRPIETLKQGEEYRVHLHLFNSTASGLKVLTNTTSSCLYHLYNSTGFDIDAQTLEFEDYNNIDFAKTIKGGNFSQVGFYTIILQCNTTGNIASYATGQFHVTPNGNTLDISQAIIATLIVVIILIMLITFFRGIFNAVVVEWQIAYICGTYLMLYCLTFVLWLYSENYLWQTPILASIFWITWLMLGIIFFPFIILVSGYLLKKQAEVLMHTEFRKQGYSPEDSRSLSKKR